MRTVSFAVYEPNSGEVIAFVTTHATAKELNLLNFPGMAHFDNCPPGTTHIINGEPQRRPVIKTEADQLREIRRTRNQLLQLTDWTQMADSPGDKAAWKNYRKALRDFPATCDPHNPIWPTPPEAA